MTHGWRTIALTLLALIGFAANSLLCRMALGAGAIDAPSFTAIRLAAGAITLSLLLLVRSGKRPAGNWVSAAALFVYAIAFSLAYLHLRTGAGALILFGVVQVTMISAGLRGGERPPPLQWAGAALALAGLIGLTWPGLTAPDPIGALLMAIAGIAWGAYSLRGRRATRPLADTAGNFVRALPLAFFALLCGVRDLHATPRGILLAIASGAIASGLGYSIWYTVLPRLTATRASIVQLSVPVLAGAAGIVVLHEPLSTRLLVAGATIIAGVLLAIASRARA